MAVINSSSYNGAYYQFYYTTSKYSQGVTQISWQFYSTGRTSSPTMYYSHYTLSASIGAGSLYSGSLPSASKTSNSSISFYPSGTSYGGYNRVNISGTFYIKHNTSGNASVNISITSGIGGVNNNNANGSGTISLSGNPPYTNVTKPTSVSVSPTIAKPGQTITVKWSGAQAGTNNPITGYRIAASQNAYPSSGATIVHDKTVSATTSSYNFTVPSNLARGSKIQFEVQTKSSHNTTTLSESPGAVYTINSLPTAPTVSVDKTVVPSAGGKVTFTVTAGGDSENQTRTLYYSTTSSGTKTQIISPWEKRIEDTSTFYFYTYDGLEYSTARSVTITKNTKPEISNFSVNGTSYTYNNINFQDNFNITAKATKTGTFNFTLQNITNNTIYNVGINTTGNITNYGVLSKWSFAPGTRYKFKVVFNDGIENSETLESEEFQIPATTSVGNIYNQHGNTNITNTNGDFYQKIRVYIPYDSYIEKNPTTLTAQYKTGSTNNSSVSNISYVHNNTDTYCDITVPSNLDSGVAYTFTINIGRGGLIRTYTFSKNRTRQFSGGSITGLSGEFKPFTNKTEASFSIPAPNYFIINNKYDFYNYNLGNSSTEPNYSAITITFSYNGKIYSYKCNNNSDDNFKIQELPTTDDTISFSLKANVWYTIAEKLELSDILGKQQINASIKITNLFGTVFTYNSTLTLNMQEKSDVSLTSVKLGNTTLNENSTSIREGQSLSWNYTVNSYNKQTVTLDIYILRKDSKTIPNTNAVGWEFYKTTTFSIRGNRDSTTKKINQTGSIILDKLSEISESKYIFFKAVLTDSFSQTTTSSVKAVGASNRHITPIINIKSYSYEQSNTTGQGKIKLTYQITDNGGGRIGLTGTNLKTELDKSLVIEKTDSTENGELYAQSSTILPNNTNINEVTIQIDNFTQTVIHIQLKAKTRLDLDGTNEQYDKTYISPVIVIYNINPTVALRYQHLGINTETFANDTVVAIAPGKQGARKKIVFASTQKENIYMDIMTGNINNFIIDGGEW